MKDLFAIIIFMATAAVAIAKNEPAPDYFDIRPTYRKDSQLGIKTGHNPFRRILQTDDRALTPSDKTTVSSQIIQALGSSPVNGVIQSATGVPTVVIGGEVYTINDEVRMTGNKAVLEGYTVIVRTIKRNEIGLEAFSKTTKTANSVPLVLPLDDFFDEK